MRPTNFENPNGRTWAPRLVEAGVSSMDIGKAAEHIVCAKLIMAGFPTFLSDQGLPFDVVSDVGDRLVRIQVKATLRPRNMNATGKNPRMGYSWSVRVRGKAGQAKRLCESHCDVVALVAMDVMEVAYFPVGILGQTMQINPVGVTGSQRSEKNWIGDVASFPFTPAYMGDVSFYRRPSA